MKKVLVAVFALLALNSFAQPWKKIAGNGNITKETRTVSNFTGIASAGSWDVMIAYGNSNNIEIEAESNLLEYIETEVENDKLKLRTKNNVDFKTSKKITIYVTMQKVNSISLAGSGDIIGKGNFTNDDVTKVSLAGSGKIKVDFKQFTELSISIAGSGNVIMSGSVETLTARIAGSGDVDCLGVISDALSVSISGSGSVKATANKSVSASIAGSGDVFYAGSATNIKKSIAGSGVVKKI